MKDVSYEILDLFETYGSDPEGIRRALAAENDRSISTRSPISARISWSGIRLTARSRCWRSDPDMEP